MKKLPYTLLIALISKNGYSDFQHLASVESVFRIPVYGQAGVQSKISGHFENLQIELLTSMI